MSDATGTRSRGLSRREWLMAAGAAALTAAAPFRLYAAPPGGPRFLLVFLRGGYDAANLLVPYSSSFYYESRPNIAVPKPEAAGDSGALALDADWALAPAVRDSIGAMYRRKEVAFVPFAGTDDASRSHFETQDGIELGQPTGSRDFRSGFMGRLATVLAGAGTRPLPMAFTDALPLAFSGADAVPNLSLKNVGKPPFDARQAEILESMYAGHRLESAVRSGIELRHEVAEEMADEMDKANRNAITAKGFAAEAGRIGRLMQDKCRLGFLDVGGWDTHVGEGAAQGALANNLANLGSGLAAYAEALGPEWRNTVVVVLSEFGRTFRENGNRGTDHGHGSVYWVLGGGIAGGRVAGEQQPVSRRTLFQDRDLPVLNDYRSVLGGVFRRLWSLSPAQSARVFERAPPVDLKLV